jgi:hypothetical protein
MQVFLSAAQGLNVVAQFVEGGFGVFRRLFFLLLQPSGALLLRSQPTLQLRHSVFERGDSSHRSLLCLLALLLQPSGEIATQ